MARLFDFENFKINVLLTKNLKAVVCLSDLTLK